MPVLTRNGPPVNGLKPFYWWGLMSQAEAEAATGDNFETTCIFCDKESHCHIALIEKTNADGSKTVPGMFHCKRCGQTGNVYTFLNQVLSLSLENTTDDDYAELERDRDLPVYILKEHELARCYLNPDVWMVPIRNHEGKLSNLFRYDPALKASGSKYAFLGTPGIGGTLYNLHTLTVPPPGNTLSAKKLNEARREYPVDLVEGQWDLLAWDHATREAGIRHERDILAVCGATNFRPEWMVYFAGRPMNILLDYDPPAENGFQAGKAGTQKIIKIAKAAKEHRPSSLRTLEWRNE